MVENKQLPILLAGPILRRSEPEQVCIWLACSRPTDIKVMIFRDADLKLNKKQNLKKNVESSVEKDEQTKPIGLGTTSALQFGDSLFVALVIAKPIEKDDRNSYSASTGKFTFPTDILLAYDIELSFVNKKDDGKYTKSSVRLNDLGLLSGKSSIVYEQNNVKDKHGNSAKDNNFVTLPSFYLQGERNNSLNILHGSCRKLHGNGKDCLAIADDLISHSIHDLSKRPSSLFLTGDQIYADDVAGPLIQHLTRFGIRLLGWEETVNGITQKLTDLGIGQRQKIVREHAKFTSESASNHLLSFGEFVATYLITWNIENWPESYPDIKTIPSNMQKHYQAEISQLENAKNVLPAVRRVLANIPTYMIFDDHEITDDWNITRESHQAVNESDCGKQIITNGLAAFWSFQGWGNDPAIYNDQFVSMLTGYFAKKGKTSVDERKNFEEFLWNYHHWSFYAPTNPRTVFLDCRTQREFDSDKGPPLLLNEEGSSSLLDLLGKAQFKRGSPIILVSQTPVFGFELAEKIQEYLARKSSVYKWDLETWAANEEGFIRFLTLLIKEIAPSHCIILSGDVHYGFTVDAQFELQKQKDHKEIDLRLPITQLTSSALKTTSFSKDLLINEILGRFSQLISSTKSLRIGWYENSLPVSRKIKTKHGVTKLYEVINKISKYTDSTASMSGSFDWMEYRHIIKPSGFRIPSLVITENNIGFVSIRCDVEHHRVLSISHDLIVRKGNGIKIHRAVVNRFNRVAKIKDLID